MPDLKPPSPSVSSPRPQSSPRRFSNRDAEQEWSGSATTHKGMDILIRPASPSDKGGLETFFNNVSHDDLYFRFLSGLRRVDDERLQQMLRDDDDRNIDFLAVDPNSKEILASAMLGADDQFEVAEFAVVTRNDMKGRGISWTLLDHAVRYAEAMGIRKVSSLESASQTDALRLEREMGFEVHSCGDDATLMIAEKSF